MAGERILIVDTNGDVARNLAGLLTDAGYALQLLYRGDSVIPLVKDLSPDLILLDILLPGMDGTEVCREIRKFSEVPILVITALADEADRVFHLELGADDYICKPFNPLEVAIRVKAVLRRTGGRIEPGRRREGFHIA